MKTTDFDYDLPQHLIARYPLPRRSSSRLLIVDRKSHSFSHARFSDLRDVLRSGDLLVLNNTKVIPSRLWGSTERRGQVELLLTEKRDSTQWKILMKNPVKNLRINLPSGISGILEQQPDKSWTIAFTEPVENIIENIGQMPIPPYLQRGPEQSDRETYQTVYATENGAVAAPTAGLHFDLELLSDLRIKGVLQKHITLHVGEGTFRPVKEKMIQDHVMHSERALLPQKTAQAINNARKEKRRVIAVGTTVIRALESAEHDDQGNILPFSARTDLFIKPPYRFRFVDVLITNFHMPRSTLLMLVSAFCGSREFALHAYEEAKSHGYRFLSYGDSMMIV